MVIDGVGVMGEARPPTKIVAVAGTHGWRGQLAGEWWQSGPWLEYMAAHGVEPVNAARPFVWSTELAGHRIWRKLWRRRGYMTSTGVPVAADHLAWWLAGIHLYAYLVPPAFGGDDNGIRSAPRQTVIVAHSHGGAVALHAAAEGLRIETLVTIGTPARADMGPVIAAARVNIRRWLHIYSDGSDRWQLRGLFGDGKIGLERRFRVADCNAFEPGVGHSGVLEDPALFDLWERRHWLRVLRGDVPPAAVRVAA